MEIVRYVKQYPMYFDNFMYDLAKLTEIVEKKISKMILEKLFFVFDGWLSGCTN